MLAIPSNKLQNAHAAAPFLEVTHVEFARRELECTVGFENNCLWFNSEKSLQHIDKGAKWNPKGFPCHCFLKCNGNKEPMQLCQLALKRILEIRFCKPTSFLVTIMALWSSSKHGRTTGSHNVIKRTLPVAFYIIMCSWEYATHA